MERFSDETDHANALVDAERDSLIAKARANVGAYALVPDGECHWCSEDIEPPRVFCDGGCATEWDIARKRRARR